MTIQQAIRAARSTPDVWIRPVNMVGTGEALRVVNDRILRVPRGTPTQSYTLTVRDILDEWELVRAETVMME